MARDDARRHSGERPLDRASPYTGAVPGPEGADARACAACGAGVDSAAVRVRGYQEGTSYAVRACRACRTSSADAAGADLGALYGAIYTHAALLPGYARYTTFAAEVAGASDPLSWLAAREDTYRGVALVARSLDPTRRSALEVGTGLGYLTYALRRAGVPAIGIDLSAPAVAAAAARYGPYYECVTLEERARRSADRFDLVVMLELIEHVADPLALLRAARGMLAPGGRIVVSTPDRDAYPAAAVWRTEQPPVHLHWFSREGLTQLAARAELACTFVTPAAPERHPAMAEADARDPILGRAGGPWRPSLGRRLRDRLARGLPAAWRAPRPADEIVDGTIHAVLRVPGGE